MKKCANSNWRQKYEAQNESNLGQRMKAVRAIAFGISCHVDRPQDAVFGCITDETELKGAKATITATFYLRKVT